MTRNPVDHGADDRPERSEGSAVSSTDAPLPTPSDSLQARLQSLEAENERLNEVLAERHILRNPDEDPVQYERLLNKWRAIHDLELRDEA